jgi:hypothetical protein
LFHRVILREKIFVPYQDIKSIYPGYVVASIGPGADGNNQGKTIQMCLCVEFTDGTDETITFPAHQLMDPEYSDDECKLAYVTLIKIYKKNRWEIIKSDDTSQKEQLQDKYQSAILQMRIFSALSGVSFILFIIIMQIIADLTTNSGNQLSGTTFLFTMILVISPVFIFAALAVKKEKEKFKIYNKLNKIKTYEQQELQKR